MGILSCFSHAAEKDLAHKLTIQLIKDLPPTLMGDQRRLLSVNKITRLLERTYAIAAKYQQEKRLGFIKRAILANSFKWELKNKNYPDDFIQVVIEGLVMELMKSTKKQS